MIQQKPRSLRGARGQSYIRTFLSTPLGRTSSWQRLRAPSYTRHRRDRRYRAAVAEPLCSRLPRPRLQSQHPRSDSPEAGRRLRREGGAGAGARMPGPTAPRNRPPRGPDTGRGSAPHPGVTRLSRSFHAHELAARGPPLSAGPARPGGPQPSPPTRDRPAPPGQR